MALSTFAVLLSYAAGECTWFVAKTLDWVPAGLGDAKDWLANSKHTTYRGTNTPIATGKAPVVGDVVVFGPGQQGALDHGHVAIVTKVHPDWTFDVTEMHFPALYKETPRHNLKPNQVEGFIASPENAKQKPLEYGGSPIATLLKDLGIRPGTTMSAQQLADIAYTHNYAGGMALPRADTAEAAGNAVTTAFDSLAGPLGKIFGFLTDQKEWWRMGVVALGGTIVLIGVVGYFKPAIPKVVPV